MKLDSTSIKPRKLFFHYVDNNTPYGIIIIFRESYIDREIFEGLHGIDFNMDNQVSISINSDWVEIVKHTMPESTYNIPRDIIAIIRIWKL